MSDDLEQLTREELITELRALKTLVNSPHTLEFLESTRLETVHQIQRWGTVHDRAKEPQDWYWLLAYLSGKALRASIDGDHEKAKHHCISSAAVLANWHAAIAMVDDRFTPGDSDIQQFLMATFGNSMLEMETE